MYPFVNPERSLIFWWSAKCGCTTVKSIMIESMVFDHVAAGFGAAEGEVRASLDRILYGGAGPDGTEFDAAVADFLARNYIFSAHCLIAGSICRVSLEQASGMRNVLFVRDPFDRFVSGVVDKHIDGPFCSVYRPSSFLDAAENIDRLEKHHFAPQASDAFLPDLAYDRVFDIRSIDFGYLSDILGMEVRPRRLHGGLDHSLPCDPGLPAMGYDELALMKAAGRLPAYDCFYDDRSRSLVSEYYRDDIDLMRRWLPPEAS